MDFPIVLSHESWIVVDKPPACLSVPARAGDADPRPCLGRLLEARMGAPIFPVHRLDYEASGLMLFARTPAAHRAANRWFEQRLVHKTYEARTARGEGAFPETEETWTSKLVRGKKRTFAAPYGQEAVTRARAATVDGGLCWSLRPVTGRSHQLRFELAHRGWPIAGDALYGSTQEWPAGGIALRAVELDLKDCPEAAALGLPERLSLAGF